MTLRSNAIILCGLALFAGCAQQPAPRTTPNPAGFPIDATAAAAISSVIENDLRDIFLSDPPTDVISSDFYWGPLESLYRGHDNGNRSIYGRIVIHPDDAEEWEADFEDLDRPPNLPSAPIGVDWWLTEALAHGADFFNCGIDGAGPGSFIAVSADGSTIYIYVAQWDGKMPATRPSTQK